MRTNLAVDPSLRSKTVAAYQPVGGATIAYTGDYQYYGDGAMLVTKSASNGSGVRIANPIPVTAGLPYAFSVFSRLPVVIPRAESAQIILEIEWLNSLSNLVATSTSTALEMAQDNTWYRLSGVWNAPAGATFALVKVIQPLPGTAGQKFVLDAFLVEQASYVAGYMDNITQGEKNTLVGKALSRMPQVINGIRLGADVSINGLVLNTIDEYGTIWIVEDISGWWGQTAPELPNIARGTQDGSYDVEGRMTARTIAVSGFFIPADAETSLNRSIDRLVSAANMVRSPGWFIANENPTKAALVRLAEKPDIKTLNARGRTEFTIVMRAGDPIKYHWNDQDPFGFTNMEFSASDVVGVANNLGTAAVTGVFKFTGPVGAGTRLFNASTEQTMTLRRPLRGAGLVADVTTVSATDGIATVRTDAPHGLRVGDEVSLLNMVLPFSESSVPRVITHVSEVFPYSFSFDIATDDVDEMASNGQVYLLNNDVLEVDTYNRTVTYNGEAEGQRHMLDILTDWITFGPGDNQIEFFDKVTRSQVISKTIANNVVTLETADAHYFIPSETIRVELPVEAPLYRKKLQGNTVTLTTEEPHGFSVGDIVDVETIEISTINNKSRTTNIVAMATTASHGINEGDQVEIKLPTTATPISKELTSNVAKLTTSVPHGFSVGDSVTVSLPTSASIVAKQLSGGQATIFTNGSHNFSEGDSVTIALPTTTTVTSKGRSGALAVFTTNTAHGYSIGDKVIISLPTTATITGGFGIVASTGRVTGRTSAAHGISVGDTIRLASTIPSTKTVTARSATATDCTLTVATGTDWVVGERIVISGVGTRYNGTHYITAVTSTTVTYAKAGAVEASVASSGSIQNRTVIETYTGDKIIETVPTTTSFTFRDWSHPADVTRATSSGSLTNLTNQGFNGTKTLVSASGSSFAYNY
ncbi:minor tail protein [Microbacterium phage Cece]|nr:minor tail protein [Microbacterium phage Cece]